MSTLDDFLGDVRFGAVVRVGYSYENLLGRDVRGEKAGYVVSINPDGFKISLKNPREGRDFLTRFRRRIRYQEVSSHEVLAQPDYVTD